MEDDFGMSDEILLRIKVLALAGRRQQLMRHVRAYSQTSDQAVAELHTVSHYSCQNQIAERASRSLPTKSI